MLIKRLTLHSRRLHSRREAPYNHLCWCDTDEEFVICHSGLKERCPHVKANKTLQLSVYDKPAEDRLPVLIRQDSFYSEAEWSQNELPVVWTTRMTGRVREFIEKWCKDKGYGKYTLYFTAKNI